MSSLLTKINDLELGKTFDRFYLKKIYEETN